MESLLKTPLGYQLSQVPRRAANLSATGGSYLSTNGWDTVSALKIEYVNQMIEEKKSTPDQFTYNDSSGNYSCSASFDTWSIVPGGDGTYIHLNLPMTSIEGWYGKKQQKHFTADRGSIIIAIKLEMLSHGASQKNLIPRTQSNDPNDPVAFLVSHDFSKTTFLPHDASFAPYIVEQAITAWSAAHLQTFRHVFAEISINTIIGKKDWAFVTPSFTTYAYGQNDLGKDPVLGILCMTGNRQPGEQTNAIDIRTIPDGCQAGFLVSTTRVLRDLIEPSLHLNWPNSTADKYKFNDNGFELKQNTTIGLPDVEHNGSTYHPVLKSFSFKITGQVITIESYTTTDISPGIVAWCNTTHQYNIGLRKNKKGQQTLVYKSVNTPVVNHGTHLSEGIKITEIILGIIAAVVIIILGILTDGAAFFVAAIIAGLLFGVAAATPQIIAAINKDDSPSIDLMSFNVSHPIKWTGGKDFVLTYASLNQCLQLGGSLGFDVARIGDVGA